MTWRFSRPRAHEAPQARKPSLEAFDFSGLSAKLLLIRVDNQLAVAVEHAEMEHVIDGGHDVQIIAR